MNIFRFIFTAVMMFAIFINAMASVTAPDFAYPKKVTAESEKTLKKAIKESDSKAIVKALMNLTIAQSEISNTSLQKNLALIDKISKESTDATLKSMLDILQADIYTSVYTRSRWKFDERQLPLVPRPTDFNEWSGEQFNDKIDSLNRSAVSRHESLVNVPLDHYAQVISVNKKDANFFPTLFDFVGYKALSIMSRLNERPILTWRWLDSNMFMTMPLQSKSADTSFGVEIFRILLNSKPQDSAAHFYCELKRLEWVEQSLPFSYKTKSIENFIDLYESNRQKPESVMALMMTFRQFRSGNGIGFDQQIYSLLNDYSTRFPESVYQEDVKKAIQRLTVPSVTVNFPGQVALQREFEVKISIKNSRKSHIRFYSVTDKSHNVLGKLITSKEIVIDSVGPFQVDTVVRFTAPAFGYYTVLPSYDGQTKIDKYFSSMQCSNLYGVGMSFPDKTNGIYVSDAITGNPVKGATVSMISRDKLIAAPLMTDGNGYAQGPENNSGYQFKITDGADKFLPDIYVYPSGNIEKSYNATATTSLPIYHLGDDVQWAVVAYTGDKSGKRVASGEKLVVMIRDANYQTVDSISATTDEFGRIEGKTLLPKTGLTGNFRITVVKDNRNIGGSSFMVSDYKLPTFNAVITSIRRDYPSRGAVTVTGTAKTYSGFPVENGKVAVNLESGKELIWFYNTFHPFYSDTLSTDDKGEFTLILPTDLLADAPYPDGLIKASFDITSPAGETRSVSTRFSLGKPYCITVSSVSNLDISNKVSVGAKVVNPMLESQSIPLICNVLSNDSVIMSLPMATPDEKLDFSALPTGEYRLKIEPVDTLLADAVTTAEMILYHPDSRDFPIKNMLWTPRNVLDFNSSKGDIIIATDRESLTVNMIVTSQDNVIEQRWLHLPAGINHVGISLPDSVTTAYVNLFAVNNLDDAQTQITITTPPARYKMNFRIESFRDKVSPLSTETWTFTTHYPIDKGVRSAVMLNMFSKAIDDILQHDVPRFYIPGNRRLINYNSSDISLRNNLTLQSYGYYTFTLPMPPSFNLYGMTWMGTSNGINTRAVKNLSMAKEVTVEKAEDEAVFYAVEAAPMMKMADSGSDSALRESVTGAGNDASESEEENVEKKSESDGNYRPSEIPLAIFQPMLTTDSEGKMTFSFTYPDASTTWILNATAYDKNMHSADITKTVIASHPLIVQGNMPRFMRRNDTAKLCATVMNNTENYIDSIATLFEAIDMNSGKTIAVNRSVISLKPLKSQVISLDLTAPCDASSIMIRIKATSDSNSDGEQSAIAVLPESQRVITTHPFYMAPDSTSASFNIDLRNNSDVTIEFCENPVWTVVTALPGLSATQDFTTSNQAAAAIFSASVAAGIIRQNPEIGNALKTWLESERTDSVLMSMLERNADLKIALLNATPWVVDAMNDTQRMTRLALLFDHKEIDNTISSAIHALAKLQRKGGGWAWTNNGDEPSEWATENILMTMGRLRRLGFMPDDQRLKTMITNAVKYLDSTVARRLDRKKTPATDMAYTYLRTLFPEIRQSTAASRVSSATVQKIIADWKNFSLGNKAAAVHILASSGYHSTAATILESLGEFASQSPGLGMWWDNLDSSSWWAPGAVATTAIILDAYAVVKPSAPEIDMIRQWLIIEKSRQDWGTALSTTEAIASILTTGTKWTASETSKCVVRVDGRIIEPDHFEKITGYFRSSLPDTPARNLDITVDKVSKTPAYGAVYCSSIQPMTTIEASGIQGLSIAKRFLVRKTTGSGRQWADATSFNIGDIVKVVLTIKSDMELSYVAVVDNRPACLEPVSQLPAPVYNQGICFYRETRDATSSIFIDFMPKGTYVLEQEFTVTAAGAFASGIATVQSQYAPQNTASSAGILIETR